MNKQKTPIILGGVLVLLLVGIGASKNLGGNVGTAEEIAEKMKEEQAAKQKASSVTGKERESSADTMASKVAAQVDNTPKNKVKPILSNPKMQGMSIIRQQKPARMTSVPKNDSAPYGQWYPTSSEKK